MTKYTDFVYREFLVGTKYCDVQNAEIRRQTKQLLSSGHGDHKDRPYDGDHVHSAVRIFDWVRDEVKYSFDFWNVKASETMRKMSGMCANKANLQIAMLRAAGIPAGYGMLRIRKEAIRTIANDEIYDKSSEVIIHVYCCVYCKGQWISADATVDRELYEAAYLEIPDWQYLSWNGQNHFRISSSYVVEDLGLRSNIDNYMDMPPRFLTHDIIKRANSYVQGLRARSL